MNVLAIFPWSPATVAELLVMAVSAFVIWMWFSGREMPA